MRHPEGRVRPQTQRRQTPDEYFARLYQRKTGSSTSFSWRHCDVIFLACLSSSRMPVGEIPAVDFPTISVSLTCRGLIRLRSPLPVATPLETGFPNSRRQFERRPAPRAGPRSPIQFEIGPPRRRRRGRRNAGGDQQATAQLPRSAIRPHTRCAKSISSRTRHPVNGSTQSDSMPLMG